jgi:hypothetical protein
MSELARDIHAFRLSRNIYQRRLGVRGQVSLRGSARERVGGELRDPADESLVSKVFFT